MVFNEAYAFGYVITHPNRTWCSEWNYYSARISNITYLENIMIWKRCPHYYPFVSVMQTIFFCWYFYQTVVYLIPHKNAHQPRFNGKSDGLICTISHVLLKFKCFVACALCMRRVMQVTGIDDGQRIWNWPVYSLKPYLQYRPVWGHCE